MRYFHRINMTGLFKSQNIAWDYMYTWCAAWPSHLRPGCLTSFPQALLWEASGRCTLSKALYRFMVLVWHSQRRSLKVCVTCSRWMIWHLEEMPTRGKVGTSRLSKLACVRMCVVGLLLCILQRALWSSSVRFGEIPTTFWTSLPSCWESLLCQSKEPIPNAVIWLDRNRTADRVQRLHCVSKVQTDCGIDSLCEVPPALMFTLSDGPFWQLSYKQSGHSGEKTCLIIW